MGEVVASHALESMLVVWTGDVLTKTDFPEMFDTVES
jgi:hypothetical protein